MTAAAVDAQPVEPFTEPHSISLMDLISMSNGESKPRKTVIYGTHGIGKTTLACNAKSPIILPFEDGYGDVHLTLKKSIPVLTFPGENGKKKRILGSYEEAMTAINFLITGDHNLQNVIIDSAEAYEAQCERKVAKDAGKPSVADIGYGKGYDQSAKLFGDLLSGMDYLAANRGMGIIIIAHAEIEKFQNPEGENYDRYTLRLNKRTSPLLQEWADDVLFCHRKVIIKSEDAGFNKTVGKAIGKPQTLIYTTGGSTHEAKNRLGLPETIPMDWSYYEKAIEESSKYFLGELIPDGKTAANRDPG